MKPSRKDIDAQARALLNKPGWDPRRMAKSDPSTELRDLDQKSRNQRTYHYAQACPECQAQITQQNDPQALCPKHLAQAMGF